MTNNTEASRQKLKALSRWEDEGGALGAPPMVLDEADMRILARLGAVLLMEWDAIPEATRNAVFEKAFALHAEKDALRIKQDIERFLDEHRNR